jgi:two-component system LytT family response regulator
MLNALIVDDEESGAKGLGKLLTRYCPGVTLVGTAQSADEAEQKISALQPDLLFLDIEMPLGNGFDLLNRIKNKNFEVIFTTAYSQYAIKAFKHNAIDYLLKPVEPEELMAAVNRCAEKIGKESTNLKKIENLLLALRQPKKVNNLPVHTQEGIIYLETETVTRLEAYGNYTIIYLTGGRKFVSSRTLKEYEELLSEQQFFRVHKSNLINLSHVKQYMKGEGGEVLMSDGSLIEVSRYKKAELLTLLSL